MIFLECIGSRASLSVGFAALRAPHPFPLAAGPLQSNDYQGVTRLEAAISFLSNPLPKASFRRGRPKTKLASLSRCQLLNNQYFAERGIRTLSSHPVAFWRRKTLQIVEQVISPDLTSHQVFRKTSIRLFCLNEWSHR